MVQCIKKQWSILAGRVKIYRMYSLIGFANLFNVVPGFVYPVFSNQGELYWEDGNELKIVAFDPIRFVNLPEIIPVYDDNIYQIGMDTIYGFVKNENNEIIFGNETIILPCLIRFGNETDDFEARKEISRFLLSLIKKKKQVEGDLLSLFLEQLVVYFDFIFQSIIKDFKRQFSYFNDFDFEDLYQEVRCNLYEILPKIDFDLSMDVEGFISRILKIKAYSFIKKRKNIYSHETDLGCYQQISYSLLEEIIRQMEYENERVYLEEVIRKLTPKEQDIIAYTMGKKTFDEIKEIYKFDRNGFLEIEKLKKMHKELVKRNKRLG